MQLVNAKNLVPQTVRLRMWAAIEFIRQLNEAVEDGEPYEDLAKRIKTLRTMTTGLDNEL